MYSCNNKTEFSAAITTVLSVTLSFRIHSDMLIKKSILVMNVENSRAA